MLTGTDPQALRDAAAAVGAHGRGVETLALDLRKEEAPAALAEAVRRRYGRLDILVNNAGTTKRGDFLSSPTPTGRHGYALKFFAHVRLAAAAWPMLAESGGSSPPSRLERAGVPARAHPLAARSTLPVAAFPSARRSRQDRRRAGQLHPSELVDTEPFARRVKPTWSAPARERTEVREWHRKDIGITASATPADVASLIASSVAARPLAARGHHRPRCGESARALTGPALILRRLGSAQI